MIGEVSKSIPIVGNNATEHANEDRSQLDPVAEQQP